MRTLKFRAWHKEDKKMLHGTRATSIPMFTPNFMFRNHEVELMQFTGLLDKNGKELYEGDLVVFDIGKKSPVEIKIEEGAVTYWSLFNMNHEFEIIGNIHEDN